MGGDLLIKLIFQNAADGMAGVQAAIDQFNALTGANLRSAEELFKDWAIAVKLDDEGSDRWDIKNIDFGDPAYTSWTVDIANNLFWNRRGQYIGNMPEARWLHNKRVPPQTALPFGVSYETFRNPGPVFGLTFQGSPTQRVAPHTGETHWWGGAESQKESILDVASAGAAPGAVVDFWTWYFIEEGWDYGYLEALVGGEWVTVPLLDEANNEVTTDTDPHDNNRVVQVLAPCDLTPGVTTTGEIVDNQGNYVYRFEGDSISFSGFSSQCLRSTKDEVTVVISNMTSGDIQVLDADYLFRLTGTGVGRG